MTDDKTQGPITLEQVKKDQLLLWAINCLNLWRKKEPLDRQWVVGSRFSKITLSLQKQGDDICTPIFRGTEEEAIVAAADFLSNDFYLRGLFPMRPVPYSCTRCGSTYGVFTPTTICPTCSND